MNQFKQFGLPRGTTAGNPFRRAHLERLRALRNSGGPGHQAFGSVVLSIPELDFAVLVRRYPELNSPDAETHTRAWMRFLSSPESAPYKVRRTDGKRGVKPSVLR